MFTAVVTWVIGKRSKPLKATDATPLFTLIELLLLLRGSRTFLPTSLCLHKVRTIASSFRMSSRLVSAAEQELLCVSCY
jgi:hypothetical protein